jgi:hypothetical protein
MTWEVITTLAKPNCQSSISLINILVGVVPCQSRNEVPGSILSVQKWYWVPRQEPHPKSVSVLSGISQVITSDLNIGNWSLIVGCVNYLWRALNASRLRWNRGRRWRRKRRRRRRWWWRCRSLGNFRFDRLVCIIGTVT